MASADITQLLQQWVGGDDGSLDELAPLVYQQLHTIASRIFHSERRDHTLQTTAIVHEAFVHLIDAKVDWQNRSHFYALAARMMRRMLVDHAKARAAVKRGGGAVKLPLDDVFVIAPQTGEDVLHLHEALNELAKVDSRKAEILELHYFGGLTYEEMGEVLGLSSSTLDREMRFSKAWLKTKLED
ncbi:MAG: sigma-70 family RNA polymerase sigma factor [Pseudomonadota bacterium]